MIDPELLEILACPDTHQPLTMADDALVGSLNAAIEGGGLQNVGGSPVEGPLDGGLVREDGAVVYPIRDRIPVLLVDEGISLPLSE
jgi:uncharacterized protein YbaR (Trm112 family)